MWRLWLNCWGFLVDEAANGAEAVQKARLNLPDLVLMDLWMPVLDGLQATRELKEDPATASIPVLALSAQRTMPAAAQVKEAGGEMLLPKPLDPDELLDKIRESFARTRHLPPQR
jgi:CheY-like chemotaxis protein